MRHIPPLGAFSRVLTTLVVPADSARRALRALTIGTTTAALLLSAAAPGSAAAGPVDPWSRGGVVVDDEFSRALVSGLGSAPTGGVYTVGDPATYTVAGGRATVGPVRPGVATSTQLRQVNAADVEVSAEVVLPTVAATSFTTYQGVQLRRSPTDSSAYRARLLVTNAGRSSLTIERVNGSKSTALSHTPLPLTVTAGATTVLDARVTGTNPVTVQARAWTKGTPTPGWQSTVTDTSPQRLTTPGAVGTWIYTADTSTPITSQLDRLTAWTLTPTTNPTTTPTPTTPPTTTPVTTTPTTPTTTPTPAPAPATPAATSPVTTTPPAPRVTRGAPTVGTTTYPVPAGALIVDGARGADTNPGTTTAPKKTITAAVTAAPTGATVVIRAGVYHESVTIAAGKSITVQNYPGEAVWLDGTRTVTGWKPTGTTWTLDGWTPQFDASASFTTGQNYSGGMLRPDYPAAAKPDQVFIDGIAQQQVMTPAQVTPGTFAVDYTTDRLVIGTNPTGHDVRATDLPWAIDVLGTKNTIQGIGVRRYATPMPRIGTLRVWGGANTIRDVHVQDAATVAISFIKPGNTADHVTVTRAGLLGIHANQADNLTITNTLVTDNNAEHFKEAPTAAGIKITRTRGITIDNVAATHNKSMGIWMDESCYNITVVNSEATDNTGSGIELELSDTAIVANNRATGNLNGILILNTGNTKIYNNEIGNNTKMGLKLWQDARRQATHPVGRDPRAPVPDPTVPWITRNITVANNIFGAGGSFQLYALDKETNRPVDTWNLTITGNLFNPRPTLTHPTMVAWGGADNTTLHRYETPTTLATAKNPTWHNTQATTYLPLTDLRTQAPTLTTTAIPLPTTIATAIGTTPGTRTIGNITR